MMNTPFSRVNHTEGGETEVATRPGILMHRPKGNGCEALGSGEGHSAHVPLLFSDLTHFKSSPPLHFFALCRYKASPSAAWVNNGVNRRQRGPRGEWAAKGARWARASEGWQARVGGRAQARAAMDGVVCEGGRRSRSLGLLLYANIANRLALSPSPPCALPSSHRRTSPLASDRQGQRDKLADAGGRDSPTDRAN